MKNLNLVKRLLLTKFEFIKRSIGSVIAPRICLACNTNKVSSDKACICIKCYSELPYTDHFETKYINSVHEKFYGRFNIVFGAALFYFYPKGIVGGLIYNYKYKRKKYLGRFLSELICDSLDNCNFLPSFDLITCVPLHQKKLEHRGFNQSGIVAEYIANHLKVRVDTELMVKMVETASQTRKNRFQRLVNISNSIVIPTEKIESIKAKHILIIDDTLTTGATIESCGQILLKNGASNISVLCISQAV
ncbi:MAG TPA: phosphoribosyltransferase family protein [Saprospiraceae bacterium]|nr:phosphoribosyltransferase family protein [Saprospiraceae bacterium]